MHHVEPFSWMKPVFPVNFQPPPPAKGKGGDKCIELNLHKVILEFSKSNDARTEEGAGKAKLLKKKKNQVDGSLLCLLGTTMLPVSIYLFFAFLTTDFDAPNAKSRTELAD